MRYNWQQNDWTKFSYDVSKLEEKLYAFAEKSGRISGILKVLPKADHIQAMIHIMVAEAVKTSEIEGEYISRRDVLSSIRNNLGLNTSQATVKDKNAEGMATLITDIQNSYAETLTKEKLFDWHNMIFPMRSKINVGAWRTHEDPMHKWCRAEWTNQRFILKPHHQNKFPWKWTILFNGLMIPLLKGYMR